MNRQIRQVAFLVLVMFATLALSVTSVQGLARPSVWESWSANGALNSDPRNRRTVSRNFDTERGPILLAGGTTIASTQKSDNGQGSEDYQRVYANGPLYAPVTGSFSPAFACMTGMETVMRSGGGLGELRIARMGLASSGSIRPGKSEQMCPSGPMPMSAMSKER